MLPQVLPGLPHKARHQVQVVVTSQLHVLQQILGIVGTKVGRKEDAPRIGEHHRTARLLYDQEAERQEHLGPQEALPLSIWPVAMHSFPNSTPGSECLPDPE
jgi:hypothetical protein